MFIDLFFNGSVIAVMLYFGLLLLLPWLATRDPNPKP